MAVTVKKQIIDFLKKYNPKNNKKILICGLTYKKNVADLRNSLPMKIFSELKKKYNKIKGYDPLLDRSISEKYKFVNSLKEFKKFDIYIVITNHSIIQKNLKKLNNSKEIMNILN